MRKITLVYLLISLALILVAAGCGGGSKTMIQPPPIDPSGNWNLQFTDANNNLYTASGLFNQSGSVVTALYLKDVGDVNVTCPSVISLSNGTVQNTDQFSGDVNGDIGTIHFAGTLNPAGSHATGTYTYTPGAQGNCAAIATTGTFAGDEVPSMSGNWTGTVTCETNCPTSTPAGTMGNITASLTQDDATGTVNGTYTITGLAQFSSGTIMTVKEDFLSGQNWQDTLTDQNTIGQPPIPATFFISGGPVAVNNTAGLGLDRSFQGNISAGSTVDPIYSVTMTH